MRASNEIAGPAKAPRPASGRWRRISQRASELARQRGASTDARLEDWLRAEREIDGEHMQSSMKDDERRLSDPF